MNVPELLAKEIMIALGVATVLVLTALTVIVRLLRRKLLAGGPQ